MFNRLDWTNGKLESGAFGRNGTMHTKGVLLTSNGETITFRPITSKDQPGRLRLEIPVIDARHLASCLLGMAATVTHWDNDSDFPPEDWRDEVARGDTRLGYAEWVAVKSSDR